MIIQLSMDQIREAVCVYVNSAKLLDTSVWEVLPQNVTLRQHTEGVYDESTTIFDGLDIRPTTRSK